MPRELHLGIEVAGYRIESVIARGGMGVVYLAEHLRLGRRVALKVLPPDLAEDETFRERFIRESRVAASIDHPNIVPIYDADEREGTLFIAMRYVEGRDLRTLLRAETRLSPERTTRIVSQVADALDAAHARGLVHRDVKPGNVLLDEAEHAYLSDFGLTKRALSVSGLTRSGQLVGTIDYVAPEQIRGDPLDGRADVYSLGAIVHECLTGTVPYPRDNEVAVLWAHVREPPPRPSIIAPEVPPAVDGVVARAMAKDPAKRFPTAGGLASELRTATGVAERLPAPAPRRRRTLGLVVGLLALAAVVAGVIALARTGGNEQAAPTSAAPAPPPAALVQIDPETNEIVRRVGEDPEGYNIVLAAVDGNLWQQDGEFLVRRAVDDGSEAWRKETDLGYFPAFGFGSAWTYRAGDAGARAVLRFVRYDAASGRPTRFSVSGSPMVEQYPNAFQALMAGRDGIWFVVLGDTDLRFIDPISGDVARYPTGDWHLREYGPTQVLPWDDRVWLCGAKDNVIKRFDVATHRIVSSIPTVGEACPIAASSDTGGQWLWLLDRWNGSLQQMDADTGKVVTAYGVGSSGEAAGLTASGFGSLWFPTGGALYRFDLEAQSTTRIPMPEGLSAGTVVIDEPSGTVWVANCDPMYCTWLGASGVG